jgi:hypothetical protein
MKISGAERARIYKQLKYAEIEQMPKIPCACGCDTMIPPITRGLKPARYAHGHNNDHAAIGFQKGHTLRRGKPNPGSAEAHRGRKLPVEELERRTATRRADNGGVYQTKRGWKHTPETIDRMAATVRRRDLRGENNPFYGRTHTPEFCAKQSRDRSGAKHPNWNGGVGVLPYGPGFTRKYKKLILERDNYTCQRCGKHQSQLKQTLQVHHLDHDKAHNDPTNLVASCNACNVWASYHRDEPFRLF